MKKFLALSLAVTAVLSLTACDTLDKIKAVELPELPEIRDVQPTAEVTEDVTTKAEAKLEVAVEELNNNVIVRTKKTVKEFYDPEKGEKLILTFAYDTPKVSIEGNDEATSAINEYLGMLDETYYTGNDYGAGTSYGMNLLHELAIDNYTRIYNEGVRDGKLDLVSSREALTGRADNKVVSIIFNDYVYISADEESHEYKAYNFDAVTGKRVTLEDLGDKFVDTAKKAVESLADASATALKDGAQVENVVREGNWFFSTEGVVFFSSSAELTDSDVLRFVVTYDDLSSALDKNYIPTERLGNGSAEIMPQSAYEDGSFEILDLVTVDADGEGYIIKADGTIYDVTISTVSYNNVTGNFMKTAERWYCAFLQDNGIQLQTVLPEGLPNLMLSYTTGTGETVNKLISQSGEDGSIVLSNTDIEAVG